MPDRLKHLKIKSVKLIKYSAISLLTKSVDLNNRLPKYIIIKRNKFDYIKH